jgi:tetraacyldisaccharide 4'-kinase
VFFCISSVRRFLYRQGILSSYKSKLDVIVVGNISVGGNGKTPVVIAIATFLKEAGVECAVLLRGYGGKQTQFPYLLDRNSSPVLVGDEPALIAKRLGIPVVIDPKRARGAAFIEQHIKAQVIICDDGLQHYALQRNVELCVMDTRGIGNGFLLPMGPLRESASRLNQLDYIVYNGDAPEQQAALRNVSTNIAQMTLQAKLWVNVKTNQTMSIDEGAVLFKSAENKIIALAGIGFPQRFFSTLNKLNVYPSEKLAFADHHQFSVSDLPSADYVLMTEKDAVKCADFASGNCWYLRVDAVLPNELMAFLMKKMRSKIQ